MSEHSHVMGGSSATKRINCPASLQAEAAVPEAPTSSFAERGSMLHAAMELMLTADPQGKEAVEGALAGFLGQDLGFDGHEITQELIDTKLRPAWRAWEMVRDCYAFTDWFIEQRVSLETIIDGAFGTADVIACDSEHRLHILDWKFGDGVKVYAEGNDGMQFYAGATLNDSDPEVREFVDELVKAIGDEAVKVVIHIVQPVGPDPDAALSTWETDEDTIDDFITLAADAADKARSENPPYKPGAWCRWCRARPTCPEYEQLADYALSESPRSMPATKLAKAVRTAKLLEGWCREVLALAQEELEGGASIPGFKLVPKRARRTWVDAEAAEVQIRKSSAKGRRVKVNEMYNRTLMTPPQLEKSRPDIYAKIAKDHVVSMSSGVTMVEDTDSRPAVVGSGQLLKEAMTKAGVTLEGKQLNIK